MDDAAKTPRVGRRNALTEVPSPLAEIAACADTHHLKFNTER